MVHFVFWEATGVTSRIRDPKSTVRESIRSYNLINAQWKSTSKAIAKYTSKQCVCSIFCYSGKITLLATADEKSSPGIENVYNLALFNLDDGAAKILTWTKILNSDVCLSKETVNPNNCIATQHKNKVIVLSISNQSFDINFHTFNDKDHWKLTKLHLSLFQSDISHASNAILQLQSCTILNNDIYYSLAYGDKIQIYKTDVIKMDLNNIVSILKQRISQCFLSVFNGHVLTLCLYEKNCLEVKALHDSAPLKGNFAYTFLSPVKLVAIEPFTGKHNNDMAVVYHDLIANQCFLQIWTTANNN